MPRWLFTFTSLLSSVLHLIANACPDLNHRIRSGHHFHPHRFGDPRQSRSGGSSSRLSAGGLEVRLPLLLIAKHRFCNHLRIASSLVFVTRIGEEMRLSGIALPWLE